MVHLILESANNKMQFIIGFILVVIAATIAAHDRNAETEVNHPIMDELLSEMSPEQKDCLKTIWEKESETMKEAGRACHESDGGMDCIKAIPQVKGCMA